MPSLTLRFWTAAAVFHLALLVLCAWLLYRRHRRLERREPGWLWGLRLLADGYILFWGGALAAVVVSLACRPVLFTAARLIGQMLFVEAPALLLFGALLHLRHRRDGHAARGIAMLAVLPLLLALYLHGYHLEPHRLQVRRYTVDLTRNGRRHGTLRLVHMSDLQTHAIRGYERDAFRQVEALQPDLLVFTGDYIQSLMGSDPEPARRDLRRLLSDWAIRPRYGAFFLEGDCEEPGWDSLLPPREGFRALQGESAAISLEGERRLTLVGLRNEQSSPRGREEVHALLASLKERDLTLVAGHRPDFVRALPGLEVDLALAGHTHGGQVVLPGFGPPVTFSRLPNRYAGGLHHWQGVPLHVSRGIGMERSTAPQVRFLCPPEITLLEILY